MTNAEATGEFVVNLAPAWLYEQINATATTFPAHISEFDAVGVEREPSKLVAPPRVAGSPVALECVLHASIPVGDCILVLGRVVLAAIDADFLLDGRPQADRLQPLARLGGNDWSTLGERRNISRIPYDDWPGHYVAPAPGGAGRVRVMSTAEAVTGPVAEHGETPTYDPRTGRLHWVDMSAG